VGIIEEEDHKEALSHLVRFQTSHNDSREHVSLKSYVERMKEGQKGIYYVCADSR
jgi:molecular chaperone HtpG